MFRLSLASCRKSLRRSRPLRLVITCGLQLLILGGLSNIIRFYFISFRSFGRSYSTCFLGLEVDLTLGVVNSRDQQIAGSVDGNRQVSVMADTRHPLDLQTDRRVIST